LAGRKWRESCAFVKRCGATLTTPTTNVESFIQKLPQQKHPLNVNDIAKQVRYMILAKGQAPGK